MFYLERRTPRCENISIMIGTFKYICLLILSNFESQLSKFDAQADEMKQINVILYQKVKQTELGSDLLKTRWKKKVHQLARYKPK